MKGRQALAAHVPELRDGREPLIALVWVGVFAAAFAALRVVDRLWPAWSPLAQIACGLAGFLIAAQFFWRRRAYRARHGEQAYRLAFARFILPGLPLIFAALFHTLVAPGERILTADTTPVSRALGLYLLLTGGLLYLRAIGTFGLDNLAMLYVYFPEESRLVNTSIYGVLRHVVYSGMARIGLAFALWRGTWFSILFGLPFACAARMCRENSVLQPGRYSADGIDL